MDASGVEQIVISIVLLYCIPYCNNLFDCEATYSVKFSTHPLANYIRFEN